MKKKKEKLIAKKLLLCMIYLMIMTILFVASYKMFEENEKIIPWDEAETTKEYTYLDITRMSEKFAFNKEKNIGIHFIITEEETGLWHTYLIAINEKDYEQYKSIIDFSYDRTNIPPSPMRVYGYPINTTKEMKDLAIKNIDKFLPKENEIKITEDNFNSYLSNSYLDTTIKKKDDFNILLCISFGLLFVVLLLFLITILDKGKTK